MIKQALRHSRAYNLYKKTVAKVSNQLAWNPSKDFFVVGITWTNGKTTTCTLMHHVLNSLVDKTMLVWTAELKIGDTVIHNDKKMTSFDPTKLFPLLNQAKEQWCQIAVLEVSSHALAQSRFEWVEFDVAVMTNITPEHLDEHWTFEAYANTKKKLFEKVRQNAKLNKIAVFPKDDPSGKKWSETMVFEKSLTYGTRSSAGLKAENIRFDETHTECVIHYMWQQTPVRFPLIGEHNVNNVLAVFSVWLLIWLDIQSMAGSLQSFPWVPGRAQIFRKKEVRYLIDFAHQQDALEKTLTMLRSLSWEGRIITVFGAPWLRDAYKRPLMWQVVDRLSDIVVLTDDDAMSENRLRVIADVRKWIFREEWQDFFIIPDREYALRLAVDIAKPWDTVLIAGKWHESALYTNYGVRERNEKKIIEEYVDSLVS